KADLGLGRAGASVGYGVLASDGLCSGCPHGTVYSPSPISRPGHEAMKEASTAAKRHFRKLAAVAYERELTTALTARAAQYERWKRAELDAFALNEEGPKAHQGRARALYKLYSYGDPSQVVARALAAGILEEKEVDARYWPLLASLVEFFKHQD